MNDTPPPLRGLVRSKTHFLSKGTLFIGEDFFRADYNILKKLIENGGNVNQETPNGHHFIHFLIKANLDLRQKLELVKLSVNRGANITSSDTSNLSAFATAISIGDKEIADFLHSKGASNKVPLYLGTQYYNIYRQFPN